MAKLEEPVADIPDELEDRAEDAWEPLLAIADAAGGHWPARSRKAAVKLTTESVAEDDSLEVRILADLKSIFDFLKVTFVSSADLVQELRRLEEAPWCDMDLTQRKLAYRLGKFGVKPKQNDARTVRGYHLADLNDAFGRYLPAGDPSKVSIRPETSSDQEESSGHFEDLGRIDASEEKDPSRTKDQLEPQKGHIRTLRTDVPDATDETAASELIRDTFPGAVEESF
jgi:hypothetical protein